MPGWIPWVKDYHHSQYPTCLPAYGSEWEPGVFHTVDIEGNIGGG